MSEQLADLAQTEIEINTLALRSKQINTDLKYIGFMLVLTISLNIYFISQIFN